MNFVCKVAILLSFFASVKSVKLVEGGKVCKGLLFSTAVLDDLKNELGGCRVVEGSVFIGFLQNVPDESFANISFPELREITGYLVIYRLAGLKSIGQLFPNLARIHGQTLFQDKYAFHVEQNPDLESIGLTNLRSISRGSVRIERNEMLCFADTVDWSLIIDPNYLEENTIEKNMIAELCPKCENSKHCWSHNEPQVKCNCNGNSCSPNGTCCGTGCSSCDDSKSCTVCKLIVGNSPNQKCVQSCPTKTFKYLDYRCVTAEECRNFSTTRNLWTEVKFIPFQDQCRESCPDSFVSDLNGTTCVKNDDNGAWKSCPGALIDSVEAAKKLKDCRIIDGPLKIALRHARKNVMKKLEDSLSGIVEIRDYLKIVRSPSITNLGFLKNLKVILGERLESNKYSMLFWYNENLQKLFNDGQQVEIQRGEIFAHFNSKLCFYYLEELASEKVPIAGNEAVKASNGNRAACNVTNIEVEVHDLGSDSVVLEATLDKAKPLQSLLYFMAYYIEASDNDTDLYQEEENWNAKEADDVTNHNDTDPVNIKIVDLKSFMRYAYYVRAYDFSTDNIAAQSEISFFKTLPGNPEEVQNLRAEAKSSSEIHVTWDPPEHMNGEFETYKLSIRMLETMKHFIKQRDFCNEPVDINRLAEELRSEQVRTITKEHDSEADDLEPAMKYFSFQTKRLPLTFFESDFNQTDQDEFLFSDLAHFSFYEITVEACCKNSCGFRSTIIARTLESSTADDITEFNVQVLPSNTSKHDVKLTWNIPVNPNGFILNYDVMQIKIDEKPPRSELICISLLKRTDISSQIIDGLEPGSYSFQISAVTEAGQGNYTAPKFVYIAPINHYSVILSPAFMTLLFMILASAAAMIVYTIHKNNRSRDTVGMFEPFEDNSLDH